MIYSCIPDIGYFDSPEFFSRALHIVTAVSIPIHSFGLYIILFKTPDFMKTVKWYLINLHVWIVLFDYTLTVLLIPFLLFPAYAGYPLGLIKYIDVDYFYPTLLALILLGYVLISIVAIFENRYYSISTFTENRKWTKWRGPWLLFHYVAVVVGMVPYGYYVPEQEEGKLRAFQKLPCLPGYIYEAPLYVFAEKTTYHIGTFVTFMALVSIEISIFVISLVRNIRNQLHERKMSPKTYQLQRQFFIALAIQMLLPLTLLIIPCVYTWVIVVINFYRQAYMNILLVMGSMHGLLSTIVMLFVHHPYREAMKMMIFGQESSLKKCKNRKISELKSSLQVTF